MSNLKLLEDEASHTIESLFPEGQIRLTELSVCNWGTFSNHHTGRIDTGGSLITGETGAGKSTFIDAHQLLMQQPGETHFNAAAAGDDRRDRTLISYVRGMIGVTEDKTGRKTPKYKRNGATFTAIRGLYRSEAGNEFTLSSLFWVGATGTSNADVKHAYVFGSRNISIVELAKGLVGKDSLPGHQSLESAFAGDDLVRVFRSWGDYETRWRDALWIHNERAPALISRAMGLKKIDDLTELVRNLVLEPPSTLKKAIDAIKEFEDLEVINAELVDATARHQLLDPLQGHVIRLDERIDEFQALLAEQQAMPTYFANERIRIANRKIASIDLQIREYEERLNTSKAQIELTTKAKTQADIAYQNAGGANLNDLEGQLRLLSPAIAMALAGTQTLDRNLRTLGLLRTTTGVEHIAADAEAALGEPIPVVLDQLLIAKSLAKEAAKNLSLSEEERNACWGTALRLKEEAGIKLRKAREQLDSLLRRPNSAMPPDYHDAREKLAIGIGIDPERLPFLAELIDVKPQESRWQGAIERALGGLRLTFVIDEPIRKDVYHWLNDNDTGLLNLVQTVSASKAHTDFRPNSFLFKLQWKEHALRDGLKRFLADHHLACVDSREEMTRTQFSLTVEGGIQYQMGRFRKDDSRGLHEGWLLGFSNLAHRKRLEDEIVAIGLEYSHHERMAQESAKAVGEAQQQRNAAIQIDGVNFTDVDLLSIRNEKSRIEAAIHQIKTSNADLAEAEKLVESLRGQLIALGEANEELVKTKARFDFQKEGLENEVEAQSKRIDKTLESGTLTRVSNRFGSLFDNDNFEERERQALSSMNGSLSVSRGHINSVCTDCVAIISSYKTSHAAHAAGLPDWRNIEGPEALRKKLPEWLAHLDLLVKDRLFGLNDRWQKKLDSQSSQSLKLLQESMKAQVEKIEEGIANVNTVLRRTEFKKNSYLQVEPRKLQFSDIEKMDSLITDAIKGSLLGDRKAHYNAIKLAIAELRRATDPARRSAYGVRPLLDARYRFAFEAIELDAATHDMIDTLDGTKGKSGGEKESFSGSIVAAALAYALTETGSNRPSYCSVFLDEAFSNTSDSVAKRVLDVFKQLGLHINLITPYKNIELARHAVNSAIVVEMDKEGESRLAPVSWEEIDRRTIGNNAILDAHAFRLRVEPVGE